MDYQQIERFQDCSVCEGKGHKPKTFYSVNQKVTLLEVKNCPECKGTGKVNIEELARKTIRNYLVSTFWLSAYICFWVTFYSFFTWDDWIDLIIVMVSTCMFMLGYGFVVGISLVSIAEQRLILSHLKKTEEEEKHYPLLEERDIFSQIEDYEDSSRTKKPKSRLTIP